MNFKVIVTGFFGKFNRKQTQLNSIEERANYLQLVKMEGKQRCTIRTSSHQPQPEHRSQNLVVPSPYPSPLRLLVIVF